MAGFAVAPETLPKYHAAFADAVRAAGGEVVELAEANVLVWADPLRPDLYPEIFDETDGIEWVQLPYAGVEPFLDHLDHDRIWTCGKGVYAEPVAEHVLALSLAGFRGVGHYSRQSSWAPPRGRNLFGSNVTILGGGGITESLVRLLGPFHCDVTVLRRSATPFPGATTTAHASPFSSPTEHSLNITQRALESSTRPSATRTGTSRDTSICPCAWTIRPSSSAPSAARYRTR